MRSFLVVALAGLAVADEFLMMSAQKAGSVLAVRQSTCSSLEEKCDSTCIPLSGTCCGLGDGSYCKVGYTCVKGGCCQIGKVCTGTPSGCSASQESCGSRCMPKGAVCCPGGSSYCDAGETCSGGRCNTSGSGLTRTTTSSSPFAETTAGSGPSPTTTSSGNTLCARKKGGGSHGGGSSSGDGCGSGAGNLAAPGLLVGAMAALPLVL
ncbi:hypothetical protein VFPFJ_04288 [Purpureocillium lilacinum]|uniref:GPI anchored serine-threonine rich protein n=1 Tax=Purpureocillium lilacinum TaxID=33203 RepID=A0A179HQC1_PURLI|nr:hypothetical protein VFPFJ_04288 [Purpureocillium lilacinum]KAK4084863.1 hypothetical protein Purlil1_10083 [Purpureocillium lilacinum]OAQ92547.1 hypothetical protein VFPFJ_04288 [Purpureocillium lilacinum]PWI67707.1 hypothetical protein PCL_02628 [Purpureocillium lilacinum]GJN73804.1 hypothetical protein PLICBS_007887 [Purpureocillium lilacinum]GJN84317.1 hypothetical protein PLIIFM63780_007873 [Purpureocillium lilacinum]